MILSLFLFYYRVGQEPLGPFPPSEPYEATQGDALYIFTFKWSSNFNPSSRTNFSPFWTATLTVGKDIFNCFDTSVIEKPRSRTAQ
jgi:hypothetical protein